MKTVLLYSMLVGIPLLGLLVILKAGERIVPPRSIGGDWELSMTWSAQRTSACPGLAFEEERPEMHVSQSGTRAEVTFGDRGHTRLSVSLLGDSVWGVGRQTGSGGCPPNTLVLEARIDADPGRDRMNGTLRWEDCESCPAATFVAARQIDGAGP